MLGAVAQLRESAATAANDLRQAAQATAARDAAEREAARSKATEETAVRAQRKLAGTTFNFIGTSK